MNKDNFFKFAFAATLIIMVLVFSSAEKGPVSVAPLSEKDTERLIYDRVDIDKIRKLIGEDKLSDREAMYYRYIETEK